MSKYNDSNKIGGIVDANSQQLHNSTPVSPSKLSHLITN